MVLAVQELHLIFLLQKQQQWHKSCEQLFNWRNCMVHHSIVVCARAKNEATRLISLLFVKINLKLFGLANLLVRWNIVLHQTECPVKYFCLRKVWFYGRAHKSVHLPIDTSRCILHPASVKSRNAIEPSTLGTSFRDSSKKTAQRQ